MSMTVERIMKIANAYAATAGDVVRGWVPVQHLTAAEEKLRNAVQALVAQARDKEAEACAQVCDEHANGRHANYADLCADGIRGRIVARPRCGS